MPVHAVDESSAIGVPQPLGPLVLVPAGRHGAPLPVSLPPVIAAVKVAPLVVPGTLPASG